MINEVTIQMPYEEFLRLKEIEVATKEYGTKYNIFCEYYRIQTFGDAIKAEHFLSSHGYKIELTNNKVQLIKQTK